MPDKDQPQPPQKTGNIGRAGMSRREFTRRAALSALAPVAAAAATSAASAAPQAPAAATPPAQSPAKAPAPSSPAAQTAPSPNLPKLSPESQAEADARAQSILAQYATRLSDDQKSDIRRLCILAQPPLDRLRAFHIQNADGAALYLKPLVEREKKPPTPAAKPAAKKP